MSETAGLPTPPGPRDLLRTNREWARRKERQDPGYFAELARGQSPSVFFVACSDSRVSPELLTGAEPGQIFVHRNVANQVRPDDAGVMAALEFALLTLRVRHVIVCGHHGCGGVEAALTGEAAPVVLDWVEPLRDLARERRATLDAVDDDARPRRLAELNAVEQVARIRESAAYARARDAGPAPELHAWVLELETGRFRTLDEG